MPLYISEQAGQVAGADGKNRKAYRALRVLFCSVCSKPIRVGELFTRWAIAGQNVPLMPKCAMCAPFTAPVEDASPNPLLQSLLADEREVEANSRPEQLADADSRDVKSQTDEALQKRLGPALARAKRPRD